MKLSNYKPAVFFLTAFLMFAPGIKAKASENGEIKVESFDEDGDPAMSAIVTLLNGGQVIEKKVPDINGITFFKEVIPGTYDVNVEMKGMSTAIRKGIEVTPNKTSYVTITLKRLTQQLDSVNIVYYKKSVIEETFSSGKSISLTEIKNSATDHTNILEMVVAVTPGILPTADGKDVYSRGARAGTNEYIIDGEKVIGSFNVPSQSVQGMTVYTGGVPACYGDFTGGLIMITTKSFYNGIQEKKKMYEDITTHMQEEKAYQEELKQKKADKKNNTLEKK